MHAVIQGGEVVLHLTTQEAKEVTTALGSLAEEERFFGVSLSLSLPMQKDGKNVQGRLEISIKPD